MGEGKGFTLVEILIVVVVLGLIAAVVTPQFSDAVTQARATSIKAQLAELQGQFERAAISMGGTYRSHPHAGHWTPLLGTSIKAPPVNAAWQGAGVGNSLDVTWTLGVRGSASAAWLWNHADMTVYASYFDEPSGRITATATD
ncbi:MAG: prepilin-type N-terminal cleavage/methylation domain-containing protein [Phycisphaerae bacterium]|jgi:prepilin-type N-terminal cleavage/methylation domain-containing protein